MAQLMTDMKVFLRQQNSAVEDYDYDSPYWTPADKKVELLSQFRKLKIQLILPENIKLAGQLIPFFW